MCKRHLNGHPLEITEEIRLYFVRLQAAQAALSQALSDTTYSVAEYAAALQKATKKDNKDTNAKEER